MSATAAGAERASTAGAAPPAEVRSWTWHLMAVSSGLLLVLLPIHVLSTWVLHDPAHFGVALYVDRWHHTGWRLFDGVLVALGLLHGGLGLNSVLAGSARRPATRHAISAVLVVVLGGVGLLVLSTIFSFNLS